MHKVSLFKQSDQNYFENTPLRSFGKVLQQDETPSEAKSSTQKWERKSLPIKTRPVKSAFKEKSEIS